MPALHYILWSCAAFQGFVAVANLSLVRVLRWQPALAGLPPLVRQVFHVHAFFVSAAVGFFAVLTARFAPEMATGTNPVLRWFAGGVAIFWTMRVLTQVGYYSSTHWRRHRGKTAIHGTILAGFSALAVTYWMAALR